LLTTLFIDACFPGYSLSIIITSYVANVTTDLYLLWIPLPMLWKSTLRLYKKIAATLVLGGGVFVIVCVTLKTAFILEVS
jgi:hypothetical protein